MTQKTRTAPAMAPVVPQQVKANPKSYAGEKITVASKLPMALQLQMCAPRTEERHERATTWNETVFHKTGPVVVINGTAFPNADVPEGMERPQMIGGYALTPGVDREWWEQWIEQNKEAPFVKNNLVFAHETNDAIRGEAREHAKVDSMLGPIKHGKDKDGNPTVTDTRMPKKMGAASALRGSMKPEEAALGAE